MYNNYCKVCNKEINNKYWIWNDEMLCSSKCWDNFKDYTQEYDISDIFEGDDEWEIITN